MEKELSYYMALNYPITVEKYIEDDGKEYFAVEIPDLPGCGSHGATLKEALKGLDESKKLWIEVSLKRGLDIAEPVDEDNFSGKFLLRIPARLHMNLAKIAKSKKISLNQYVKSLLEQSDIVESLYKHIQKNDQKFISIIETQNRIIERLERRVENLESMFEPRLTFSGTCASPYVTDSSHVNLLKNPCGEPQFSTGTASLDIVIGDWRRDERY